MPDRQGQVAIQYHTARFRLVPRLAKALSVPTPDVRKPGSVWTELPRPVSADAAPVGHVRLGYAPASTVRQSLDAQLDSLAEAGVTRAFSEKISIRATRRPELETAVKPAGEIRFLRRRRDPRRPRAQAARPRHRTRHARRRAQGRRRRPGVPHRRTEGFARPFRIVFTVLAAMSGMEREYIRAPSKAQEMSLRDIAKRLVITTGTRKGEHPSPATAMRMLREHDEKAATTAIT